jgi:hypothetical protein
MLSDSKFNRKPECKVDTWVARLLLATIVSFSAFTPAQAAENETVVEAAFIFQFTHFIDWPAKSGDFKIAVVGDSDLATQLELRTKAKKKADRSIVIQNIAWEAAESVDCDVMVFTKSSSRRAIDVVKKLKNKSILTVGYSEGLASDGVMVNFYMSDATLKFEINSKVASDSGLQINSHLLNLARIVK